MRPCVPSALKFGRSLPRLAFAIFSSEAEAARACDVVNACETNDDEIQAESLGSPVSACQRKGIPEVQLCQLDTTGPSSPSPNLFLQLPRLSKADFEQRL
jgi:hypothetical protein